MSRLVLVQHYISLHYIKLIYQLAQQAYIIYCMTVIYLITLYNQPRYNQPRYNQPRPYSGYNRKTLLIGDIGFLG